jgi:hypothetical protein
MKPNHFAPSFLIEQETQLNLQKSITPNLRVSVNKTTSSRHARSDSKCLQQTDRDEPVLGERQHVSSHHPRAAPRVEYGEVDGDVSARANNDEPQFRIPKKKLAGTSSAPEKNGFFTYRRTPSPRPPGTAEEVEGTVWITYPKVVSWARKKGYALSGTSASL